MKNLNVFIKIKRKIICFFNIHKWVYNKNTIVKCNKTCEICGKKMSSMYDISYGETYWINGNIW